MKQVTASVMRITVSVYRARTLNSEASRLRGGVWKGKRLKLHTPSLGFPSREALLFPKVPDESSASSHKSAALLCLGDAKDPASSE